MGRRSTRTGTDPITATVRLVDPVVVELGLSALAHADDSSPPSSFARISCPYRHLWPSVLVRARKQRRPSPSAVQMVSSRPLELPPPRRFVRLRPPRGSLTRHSARSLGSGSQVPVPRDDV